MTHPYNECSSTSIGISKSLDSTEKDKVGILIIGLFSLLGLGYMFFNPIFLHNSNYSKNTTSFQKKISATSLNSEKTAAYLIQHTNNNTAKFKVINANSLAADTTN